MPAALVALALARGHEVVLERPGRRCIVCLLVEVRSNAAASLGVEQGDIADDKPIVNRQSSLRPCSRAQVWGRRRRSMLFAG